MGPSINVSCAWVTQLRDCTWIAACHTRLHHLFTEFKFPGDKEMTTRETETTQHPRVSHFWQLLFKTKDFHSTTLFCLQLSTRTFLLQITTNIVFKKVSQNLKIQKLMNLQSCFHSVIFGRASQILFRKYLKNWEQYSWSAHNHISRLIFTPFCLRRVPQEKCFSEYLGCSEAHFQNVFMYCLYISFVSLWHHTLVINAQILSKHFFIAKKKQQKKNILIKFVVQQACLSIEEFQNVSFVCNSRESISHSGQLEKQLEWVTGMSNWNE